MMTIVNNQLQCEEIQRMEFCRDHFLHLRPQLLLDTVAIPGYEVEADLGRGHLHKVMQTALLVRSSGQVAATMTLKKGTSWGSKQEDTNLQQIGVRLRCRSRSTQTRVAL